MAPVQPASGHPGVADFPLSTTRRQRLHLHSQEARRHNPGAAHGAALARAEGPPGAGWRGGCHAHRRVTTALHASPLAGDYDGLTTGSSLWRALGGGVCGGGASIGWEDFCLLAGTFTQSIPLCMMYEESSSSESFGDVLYKPPTPGPTRHDDLKSPGGRRNTTVCDR